MHKRLFLPLAIAFSFSSALSAQEVVDTLRRELTVVSDHVARIESHAPLAPTYEYDKPKLHTLRPTVPPSTGDFTPAVVLPRYPVLSNAARQVPRSPSLGYLTLVGGIDPNINARGGIRHAFSSRHILTVDALLLGNWRKAMNYRLPPQIEHNRLRTGGEVAFEGRGERVSFQARVGGGYDRFSLFGYNPSHVDKLSPKTPYATEDYQFAQVALSQGSGADSEWKGRLSIDRTAARYSTGYRPAGQVRTQLHLGYMSSSLKPFRIGGEGILWYFTEPISLSPRLVAEIAPQIQIQGDGTYTKWHITAGIGVSSYLPLGEPIVRPEAEAGSVPSPLILYPVAKAELTIDEQVQLFLDIDGGYKHPAPYIQGEQQRFVAPGVYVRGEQQRLMSDLGVRAYVAPGLELALSGGYDIKRQAAHFVSVDLAELLPTGTPLMGYTTVLPQYSGMRVFHGDLSLRWATMRKLELTTHARYQHHKLPDGLTPSGLPSWLIEAELIYRPIASLQLAAVYRQQFGATYRIEGEKYHVSPRYLSLEGSWHVLPQIILRAALGNPFFGKGEQIPFYTDDYPAGFSIGGSWLF